MEYSTISSVSGAGRSRLRQQVLFSPYDRQPKLNGKRDSELTECGVTGQVVPFGAFGGIGQKTGGCFTLLTATIPPVAI